MKAKCGCCGEIHLVIPGRAPRRMSPYVLCYTPGVGRFRVYSMTPMPEGWA